MGQPRKHLYGRALSHGINFEVISEFNSRGGAAQEFYEDFDIEPMVGENYYRIAIHRVDGSIAYSDVKKVEFADMVDYQIFPNRQTAL